VARLNLENELHFLGRIWANSDFLRSRTEFLVPRLDRVGTGAVRSPLLRY
jgi:hypothetical protein